MTEEEKKNIVKSHLIPTDYRLIFRVLAMFVSWYFNKSVFLGIFHFLLGWVYLAYVLFLEGFNNGKMGKMVEFYLG